MIRSEVVIRVCLKSTTKNSVADAVNFAVGRTFSSRLASGGFRSGWPGRLGAAGQVREVGQALWAIVRRRLLLGLSWVVGDSEHWAGTRLLRRSQSRRAAMGTGRGGKGGSRR